jgi:hypothetical protein
MIIPLDRTKALPSHYRAKAMTQLWRIHIRPDGGDPARSYAFCLRKEVIGVGWAIDNDEPLPLERYLELSADAYPDGTGNSTVRRLASMAMGDLVWMRSTDGVYHLCKVHGPWKYEASREARAVDIVNTRRVEIAEVGVEIHVPGKIIAAFRSARTVQRINDEIALAASVLIWNKLTDDHLPVALPASDIFSLLSTTDCEDLISVYLQTLGWVVYPARRRSDTSAYEFVLRHRSDHREAVVQVKTGYSVIDLGAMPSSVDVAFAFQPNDQYTGRNPKAVRIKRDDVLGFIAANPRLVPDAVSEWITFVGPLAGSPQIRTA